MLLTTCAHESMRRSQVVHSMVGVPRGPRHEGPPGGRLRLTRPGAPHDGDSSQRTCARLGTPAGAQLLSAYRFVAPGPRCAANSWRLVRDVPRTGGDWGLPCHVGILACSNPNDRLQMVTVMRACACGGRVGGGLAGCRRRASQARRSVTTKQCLLARGQYSSGPRDAFFGPDTPSLPQRGTAQGRNWANLASHFDHATENV